MMLAVAEAAQCHHSCCSGLMASAYTRDVLWSRSVESGTLCRARLALLQLLCSLAHCSFLPWVEMSDTMAHATRGLLGEAKMGGCIAGYHSGGMEQACQPLGYPGSER